MVYNLAFSIGFGPIPWMMNGELFSEEAKSTSSSLSTAMNWTCAFLVTKFNTNIEELINTSGTYFLYGSFVALGAVFVILVVPETKGKSPQEIKAYFMGDKSALNGSDNKAFKMEE
jgi:hypothetical protein